MGGGGQMELFTGELGCRVVQSTQFALWNILTFFKKKFWEMLQQPT